MRTVRVFVAKINALQYIFRVKNKDMTKICPRGSIVYVVHPLLCPQVFIWVVALVIINGNDIRYVFIFFRKYVSYYIIIRKKVRETDVDYTSFAVQLRTAHARHTRREGLKANYSRLNGLQWLQQCGRFMRIHKCTCKRGREKERLNE